MEAEMRVILTAACRARDEPTDLSDLLAWVDTLYGPNKPSHAVDELIAERAREARSE